MVADISQGGGDGRVPKKQPTSTLTDKISSTTSIVKSKLSDFDSESAIEAIMDAPRRIQKELRKMTVFGSLTRFPAPTVGLCVLITMFFLFHSGILDKWTGTTSLNVNGDLEVYLPEGSTVKEDLATIEEDWTTNAMIIYVDIDETICKTPNSRNYAEAVPIYKNIKRVSENSDVIDNHPWTIVERKDFLPDEKNKYSYSFITYKRN